MDKHPITEKKTDVRRLSSERGGGYAFPYTHRVAERSYVRFQALEDYLVVSARNEEKGNDVEFTSDEGNPVPKGTGFLISFAR
jgi:hypothetical protein